MGIAFIIFDISIVLGLALAILRGYRRGVVKTAILSGVKVALLILLLIFSFSLAESFLNIESLPFTNNLSLGKYLLEELEVTENFSDLILSLTVTVIRVVILIGGIIIIHIISPIIRGILKLFIPLIKKDSKPILKWAGAIVGGVYYLITFCLLTLPIYGIFEVTKFALDQDIYNMETDTQNLNNSEEPSEEDIIIELKDSLNKSFILKITSNVGKGKDELFGSGAKCLGSYLTIKTEQGKINIVKEVNAFYKLSSLFDKILGMASDEETETDINEMIDSITEDDIDEVISVMKNSVLIKVLYDEIPEIITDMLQDTEDYQIDVDLEKIHNANIDDEFDKLGSFLKLLLNVVKEIDLTNTENTEQFITILDSPEMVQNISSLIDKLFDIVLVEEIGSPLIVQAIDEALENNGLTFLVGIIDKEYLQNELSLDFSQLIDAYQLFKELNLMSHLDTNDPYEIDFSISTNEDKLKTLFNKLLTLRLIDGYQKDLILYVVEAGNLEAVLPLTETDFININWSEENTRLTNLLVNIVKLIPVLEKLNEDIIDSPEFVDVLTQVGITFDSLYECNITKRHAFNLLETAIVNLGYEITFTQEEKVIIINNTGKEEFKLLAEVVKDGKNIMGGSTEGSVNINTLSGTDVTNIMLKASNGIIASKVIGIILNELLGSEGLDINPIDINGNYKYDFRSPEVLKNEAVSVGNYIELHKKMNNLNIENMDSSDINEIQNLIANLGNDGNNNIILEDILNTIAPNTEVSVPSDTNWQDEASVVSEILTAYSNTPEGEVFDISEHPELSENIESSSIAKALLEYMKIIN